jgi:hypothetical protein
MRTLLFMVLVLCCNESNCQDDFENQLELIKLNIQKPFETLRKDDLIFQIFRPQGIPA